MRARALGIVLVTAVLAGGCGSDSIPPPTAASLLTSSRAVEARLAAGDRCGADRLAARLLREAERAIEAKLVPAGLAVELHARAARLSSTLTCPPPPPPPPVVTDEGEDGDGGENGKGKGRGKKKGHDR